MNLRTIAVSLPIAATLLVLPPGPESTAALPASVILGSAPSLPSLPVQGSVGVRSAPAAGIALQPLPSQEIPVAVQNVNSGEIGTFLLSPSGYVRREQAAAMERFFSCKRTGRHRPLANGVLVLLADIAQRWPGRIIEVVSGFRAPPYGAPNSKHFTGHAIDLRVRGVRTTLVRDFVWREHQGVGVGHYRGDDFVHVDWRPADGDMAWSARSESTRYQYNPRWAKRARRGVGQTALAHVH